MPSQPRHPVIQHRAAPSDRGQKKPTIPQFRPLPPTSTFNRIVNAILAPIFYLIFTIVVSIIVVPIYTVIEQIKHGGGRNKRGGERVGRDRSAELKGEPQAQNRMKDFLNSYGGSYGGEKKHDG